MGLEIEAEMTIAQIVEAMLPTFSDSKLGLLVSVRMDMTDYGYGRDGNTLERDGLTVRETVRFLFVRPSNYTKVYLYHPDPELKGLKGNPIYTREPIQWHLESDHDSCWRSDGMRELLSIYYKMGSQFDGREVTGEKIRTSDISRFFCLDHEPTYVELTTCEQVNPKADRWSKEGRDFCIAVKEIDRDALEIVPYWANDAYGHMKKWTHGWLIKGSRDHQLSLMMAEKNPKPSKDND